MVDVRLGSKFASSVNRQIPPLFHNSGTVIYPESENVICSHKRVKILELLHH